MKYGIHYAYWQHNWKADLCSSCKRASELGFDILEVSGGSLLESTQQELKELKEIADGLEILIYPCHGLPKEYDTSSPNEATRKKGIELVKRLFECMDIIGSKQLGGILYSYWPAFDYSNKKYDVEKAREYSLESMSFIADEAKQHDIILTLEVVNRFENFIFNDVKSALEYVKTLNKENVKLLLDLFHMNIEEDNLGDAIRMAGDYLGHFHIGECNRKVPGQGRMDWDNVAKAIKDIGYQKAITFEPFVMAGGEVADDVCVWRDLVEVSEEKLNEDIKEGLLFIKNKFD
jgi:D-psicose/D-tagatose/L-ribulose 3-epimerase